MVEARENPRGGLGRQESQDTEKREVAADQDLQRYFQVEVHPPNGRPVGSEDFAGGFGDAEAGDEGRQVVRDGRR